jgi:hypothetical protein
MINQILNGPVGFDEEALLKIFEVFCRVSKSQLRNELLVLAIKATR